MWLNVWEKEGVKVALVHLLFYTDKFKNTEHI
jgi:hypothetical protein